MLTTLPSRHNQNLFHMTHIRKFRNSLIIFSGFIFISTAEIKSQSYIPMLSDSIYWDIAYADMNVLICSEFGLQVSGPYRWAIDGDTTINGVVYKKFRSYKFQTLLTQPSPNCPPFAIDTIPSPAFWGNYYCMREDTTNQQVFLYDLNVSQEFLWYDFDVQIGDTLLYQTHGEFIVDTIFNIVTLDGITRRYVECSSSSLCGYYIEGLGGVAGLMYEPFVIFEGGPWLMCTKDLDQNTIYEPSGIGGCYNFTTGINSDINQFEAISLYPNPAEDKLYLKDLPLNPTVVLYNTLGENIATHFNLRDNHISINALPEGLYFVCLIQDNISYSIGNFVKQ